MRQNGVVPVPAPVLVKLHLGHDGVAVPFALWRGSAGW